MKITNIVPEAYSWPRQKPIRNGKHVYTHAHLGLVRIETDEGVTGIGLGAAGKIGRTTVEHLTPELIGEDPIDVERLWHKMWVPKLIGRRGLTTRAISAIDNALWDIRAKVAGMPLYKLLGGYRDRVPSYIAGGYYVEGKGLKELAEELVSNVEFGARAVKMKIGGVSIREDVERVKAAREAIGPDIKLLIDANCAYRYYEAIQMARRVEEYDIFWFEEPVAPDDYEGHRKLAAMTSIPIATGENEYTRYGFRDLIEGGCAAILNADVCVLGGITEFMKVAALAQAHDLDIAPHGNEYAHIHLVAAISNGLLLEYGGRYEPMRRKIFKQPLEFNSDGTISASNTPGSGIDLNFNVLEPYRVA